MLHTELSLHWISGTCTSRPCAQLEALAAGRGFWTAQAQASSRRAGRMHFCTTRPIVAEMTEVERLQQTGYRRLGSPTRGFRYRGAPAREIGRLSALRLPPAWRDVAISRNPKARLVAVGRDRKGRWQYRYSEAAVHQREARKYARLLAFGAALPGLRAYIDAGLRRGEVMAAVLRILSTCFMRPGSEIYAKENGSFGIATLRKRHATVHGDTVRFHYMGKSGQEQFAELKDRRVARIVRELKKQPGREIFPVTRQQIN